MKKQRDGLVRFNFEKADRLRIQKGWSKDQLAAAAGLSRNTVIKVLQGEPCFPNTAKLVAMALDVDLSELIQTVGNNGPAGFAIPGTEEWEVEEYLSEWKTTSNGLQYRVCRLRHKADPRQLGRGKFYDLLGAAVSSATSCSITLSVIFKSVGA